MIVFEGLDGSGKTTLSKKIAAQLSLPYSRFPNYERIPLLLKFLKGEVKLKEETSFLLFLADIMEGTPSGECVVDRYVFSTLAYAVDIPLQNAKAVVEALPFRRPEKVIYFDVSPELGLNRKISQGVELSIREKASYLEEVRNRYLAMAEQHFFASEWHVVDASLPLENVEKQVNAILSRSQKAGA